jgi:hypothetical protein
MIISSCGVLFHTDLEDKAKDFVNDQWQCQDEFRSGAKFHEHADIFSYLKGN